MIVCTYVGLEVGFLVWESVKVTWSTKMRHIVNIMLKPVVVYEGNEPFLIKLLAVLNFIASII
jgi:hypothetical protein